MHCCCPQSRRLGGHHQVARPIPILRKLEQEQRGLVHLDASVARVTAASPLWGRRSSAHSFQTLGNQPRDVVPWCDLGRRATLL